MDAAGPVPDDKITETPPVAVTAPAGTGHPSPTAGRVCIVVAAVLWSSSGAFTKVLREATPLGLNEPLLTPLQIAAIRVLFAGAVLLPLLGRRDLVFRP